MAFDSPTRGKLQRLVSACRKLLADEFDDQLQSRYGIYAKDGRVLDLDQLVSLDDDQRAVGALLRERIVHLQSGLGTTRTPLAEAVRRVLREQAFTLLNRFAALRMAEERDLVLQCVGDGLNSKGFQVFETLASADLGNQYERYRVFLDCLFDELSLDLGVLFDRFSPFGLLFPREGKLKEFFQLLNDPELKSLWREDETIGWIYQYFNDETERKKMRDESSAPRNSRELAVRNQFFTPRYVVEFLTDNTLGRLWYEMTRGNTQLTGRCRYLVRRPNEIILGSHWPGMNPPPPGSWVQRVAAGNLTELPERVTPDEIAALAFLVDGYAAAERLGLGDVHESCGKILVDHFDRGVALPGSLLMVWLCLFSCVRGRVKPFFPRGGDPEVWEVLYAEWRRLALFQEPGDSADVLLRAPVIVPARPAKDPRTIRLLDPACGSMHFGLYAFDLFETIYEEAWQLGHVRKEDFALADGPLLDWGSVQLTAEESALSNYSGERIPVSQAYVVVAAEQDGGDGIMAATPYLVAAGVTFRVPFAHRVPLGEFNFAEAVRQEWFSEVSGVTFLGETDAFTHAERESWEEKAHRNFTRQIPRLIVEHNLHGVDIDPRAAQIAGLSLWLRAQRAWQDAGVKPADRPRITRSNIVCAEPMPGEKELLREFVEQQFPAGERPAFAFLLEKIFDRMTLAGEAGSLLRIEEEIRTAIAEAKRLWKAGPKQEQGTLFPEAGLAPEQGEMRLDLSGITDEQFWARAEQRIYEALEAYAEQSENEGGFQRRLFADDAAQGFAFIDLCRKRYDVVVMNPPFGEPAENTRAVFKEAYPEAADNVAVCFMLRGEELLAAHGITSSITDCSWAKKYDYQKFRSHILNHSNLRALVHLGWGVLDNANVETNACVRGNEQTVAFTANLGALYDKADLLRQLTLEPSILNLCSYLRFDRLPNDVFAFEMGQSEYGPYEAESFLSSSFMVAVAGVKSSNSTADFRCWWEVPMWSLAPRGDWSLLHNGSPYCPIHYPVPFAVRSDQGKWTQIMANGGARPGEIFYNNSGLAFGKRTDEMYAYVKPAGEVFSQEGQALFPIKPVTIWGALALANSSIYNTHVNYVAGQHKYHNYLNKVCLNTDLLPVSSDTMRSAHALLYQLDASNELTHGFRAPMVCSEFDWNLSETQRSVLPSERLSRVLELRWLNDKEIRRALDAPLTHDGPTAVDYYQQYFCWSYGPTLPPRLWLSYAFGIVFGRWDIRYATGERPAPELPDPFAPLPVCPPGMLQGDDGLPLSPEAGRQLHAAGHYPLDVAWDGILVDDPEHPLDLEHRVRTVLQVLWQDRADDLEHEACALLGVPTLRDWFRRPAGFFADHLKRYSKSRRQAPIYWPLSTKSGRYTLWLYYHRLNDQTLYTCVTDFVKPKLESIAADAGRLVTQTQTGGTAKDREELQGLRDYQAELQELHDELLRVAQLPWKPNLNDGVLITASPLAKLFRLPKWQKDLATCWEELAGGDYDWAHLAYTIWPGRVREKCRTDRSLAIAHGLEGLCEVAAPKPKIKKTRKKSPGEDML